MFKDPSKLTSASYIFSFSDANIVENWQQIDERIEIIKTLNYNELSTQPCWKLISNKYSIIIKDFGEKSWKKY
jgi:hypothetical protein